MSKETYEENHFLRGEREPTITDYVLACHYPFLLMVLAENRQSMSFKEFLTWAKTSFPNVKKIQNAIPVSTGRRFEFIRIFTKSHNLPDLSAWVVSTKGKHNKKYLKDFDPDAEKNASAEVNWRKYFGNGVDEPSEIFREYLKILLQSIPVQKQTLIPEKVATKMMREFFVENRGRIKVPPKTNLAEHVGAFRQSILADIMNHIDPEEAFKTNLPNFD